MINDWHIRTQKSRSQATIIMGTLLTPMLGTAQGIAAKAGSMETFASSGNFTVLKKRWGCRMGMCLQTFASQKQQHQLDFEYLTPIRMPSLILKKCSTQIAKKIPVKVSIVTFSKPSVFGSFVIGCILQLFNIDISKVDFTHPLSLEKGQTNWENNLQAFRSGTHDSYMSYMSYITNKVWSLFLHPYPIKNEVKTNSILKDKQPRLMGVCTLVYVSGQIVGKKSLNFNCFGGFWRGFTLLFTTISKVTNPWEEVVMVCARYI